MNEKTFEESIKTAVRLTFEEISRGFVLIPRTPSEGFLAAAISPILAEVPKGYGMTVPEARAYANVAYQAFVRRAASMLANGDTAPAKEAKDGQG